MIDHRFSLSLLFRLIWLLLINAQFILKLFEPSWRWWWPLPFNSKICTDLPWWFIKHFWAVKLCILLLRFHNGLVSYFDGMVFSVQILIPCRLSQTIDFLIFTIVKAGIERFKFNFFVWVNFKIDIIMTSRCLFWNTAFKLMHHICDWLLKLKLPLVFLTLKH